MPAMLGGHQVSVGLGLAACGLRGASRQQNPVTFTSTISSAHMMHAISSDHTGYKQMQGGHAQVGVVYLCVAPIQRALINGPIPQALPLNPHLGTIRAFQASESRRRSMQQSRPLKGTQSQPPRLLLLEAASGLGNLPGGLSTSNI